LMVHFRALKGLAKDGAKPWSALRSGKPQGTSSVDQWTLFMSSQKFEVLLLAFNWMERLRPNFSATSQHGPLVHLSSISQQLGNLVHWST